MPLFDLPLILIRRDLGDVHVGGALLFDEVLAIHAEPDRLEGTIRRLAREILAKISPLDLHRRVAGQTPQASELVVRLEPPRESVAWREPIDLRLDILRWRHGEEAWIGFIPALSIEVVTSREEQLDELLARHARVALAREGLTGRLFDLAQLARGNQIAISRETITVDVATPTQLAADPAKEEDPKPIIADAGVVLDDEHVTTAYEIDSLVERLADVLVGRRPRSVLLVGPSGVGKTAAFTELFRQRRRHRLSSAPFWMTSGARLIAGMTGFGVWQERCQRLCQQAKRDGAILHLGNLVELMEVGKAGGGQFGIASFFRPFLSRGDVLAVAECTPEQLPMIERDNPHLLAVFQTITVDEPTNTANKLILLKSATALHEREGGGPPVTLGTLDRIDQLHRRYATYSASPGRPLRFLENLLRDHPVLIDPASGARLQPAPITPPDITAAFARETGLPLFLLDDATPLDLDAARRFFAQRVIGQEQAVDLISDLLATIKAAMNRPRRPIASLLFIGPTGVGKTEMAKALAAYFFGEGSGADGGGRLVRFDMSEYATPAAVARLVGASWENEGLLTAKVREQAFCVLLFDEFEKAHPAFFDMLLQVLGEGRLTDAAGRLADFSNAIIVMTSNLGAESFGGGPFGLARVTTPAATQARAHFTDSVRDFLRPELFNRIDRVIPFLPLNAATIERIAGREIELISRRDGVRERNLELDVSGAAVALLARTGYDPLYGARPLKRRIERDLLAPLANAVNQYAPATPLLARIDATSGQPSVVVRAKTEAVQPSPVTPLHPSQVSTLRRRVQVIARSPAALALQNELFTLDRSIARRASIPGPRTINPVEHERQKRLRALTDSITALSSEVVTLEDALLLHFYEGAPLPFERDQFAPRLAGLRASANEALLNLFTLNQDDPHTITIAVYGNAPAQLFNLASSYRAVAAAIAATPERAISASYFTRYGKNSLQRMTLPQDEIESFLSGPRAGVLGIILGITAPYARARFETEAGLHVIDDRRNHVVHPLLVDTAPEPAANYRPPKDVEFRIALAGQRRRTYDVERGEANDTVTGKVYHWDGRSLTPALATAIQDHLEKRLEAMLEP